MPNVVYVLECVDGKFYVGRCWADRLRQRLLEHRRGGPDSSLWTRMHRAIRILTARVSKDPLDEDRVVLDCMRTHGIDNVRGGSFGRPVLSPAQVDVLSRILDHAAGRCFVCRGLEHLARNCPQVRP
jgi:hypothetical protein